MYICIEKCLDEFEGPAINLARLIDWLKDIGRCEVCGEGPVVCFDIPTPAGCRKKDQKVV